VCSPTWYRLSVFEWLPEPLRPIPVDSVLRARQAAPLRVISLLIGALGLTSLPGMIAAWSAQGLSATTIDLALNVSLGVTGLVAFVLAWRGRLEASAWAMLVGGLLIWVVAMPTMGLASQASSQFLLTYPLLLAGLVLDRTALWSSAVVLILAVAAGAWFDAEPGVGPMLPGFNVIALNLVVYCVLVDWFGTRMRQVISAEAEKSAALADANARLLVEQAERAQLERALATTERLEAIGRLAGSVAHDFNNLLMGVRSNVELSAALNKEPEIAEMLEVTIDVIDRATGLTGELLRFSKGESPTAELLDVHRLIRDAKRIYVTLVGNGVELEFDLAASESIIAFNPSAFEQILLNLIVNAADAMPDGGKLEIGTRNPEPTPMAAGGLSTLELIVADEGTGISDTVMARMFQPFFTTKRKGTGIGLATVHDIVTKAGGSISVESKLGLGSTFRLSFPLHRDRAQQV
jgi:signal transduction histidine kinase